MRSDLRTRLSGVHTASLIFRNATLQSLQGRVKLTVLQGRRQSSSKPCDPLRILFCGSDEFSRLSLQALSEIRNRNDDVISSIDVVCRPPKKFGTGFKVLREVPIKALAKDLKLPVHEIDTFTGWNLPRAAENPINLIIAVSFGLFVPQRILRSAKYGGLNIHPSFLPEFRGPAPIHHTLLHNVRNTGITLQTLHPERFDHGKVLAQTPRPGFELPDPQSSNFRDCENFLGAKGAEMLVHGIRHKLFVPPVTEVATLPDEDIPEDFRYAPKITTKDAQVDWSTWTAQEIVKRERVFGDLWDVIRVRGKTSDAPGVLGPLRRTKFHGFRPSAVEPPTSSAGDFFITGDDRGKPTVAVKTCDAKCLTIQGITIDGKRRTHGAQAAGQLGLHDPRKAVSFTRN